MKSQKILLILICLFIVSQISFAQEKNIAILLDEFGKPCSEDLMARLDAFFIALKYDSTVSGYIVFYGDRAIEGTNLNYIKYLTEVYPKGRFNEKRLFLVRGANQDQMKIQLWVIPAGADSPIPQSNFISQKITSTSQFDKSRVGFNKDNGKLDIYSNGFYNLGCDFSPNENAFAETLLSNKELTGYLIVYTKFGKDKKYADRIAKFALSKLTINYKVPRNRLKTVYGGNRKESEIEFWFVPGNELPPKLMPVEK